MMPVRLEPAVPQSLVNCDKFLIHQWNKSLNYILLFRGLESCFVSPSNLCMFFGSFDMQ